MVRPFAQEAPRVELAHVLKGLVFDNDMRNARGGTRHKDMARLGKFCGRLMTACGPSGQTPML